MYIYILIIVIIIIIMIIITIIIIMIINSMKTMDIQNTSIRFIPVSPTPNGMAVNVTGLGPFGIQKKQARFQNFQQPSPQLFSQARIQLQVEAEVVTLRAKLGR